MKTNFTTRPIDRRAALRVLGSSAVAAVALARVTEARADDHEEKKAVDCSKEGKIDKGSAQMRKALQYVDETKKKGQVCSSCLQWKAPEKKEQHCGGCKLFTGPVSPNGYCLSYAPAKKG
ncbi:MAG: high-potential iron-sulfur protein [Myxococcota bacterium]